MNNIKPKERSERVSHNIIKNIPYFIFQITNRNRDNIEKAYLQDRVGMFNKPSEKININSPDPNSDIYISEGERFNKDFAAYDYNIRNIQHERKKEMYQTKKNQLYERERKRWERMDYEYLKAENKIMMNKEKNLVGRKNNPGMAFNPLTLQYDNSVQGEILKRRDDESKFRALMRATNIDKHANAGYNIINGQERNIMETRMKQEIEPSVYQKNIDKINEMNQRHNDNDNFYTKGPSYSEPQPPYQMQEQYNNQINEEIPKNENIINQNQINMENRQYTPKNDNFNNIPPKERNYDRINPNDFKPKIQNEINDNNYNRPLPPRNNNYQNNNRDYRKSPYEDNYRRMTPSNHGYNYDRNEEYNQIPPDHYSEPGRYQNMRNDFDRQYNYMGNKTPNNYEDYKNQDYYNEKIPNSDYHPLSHDGNYNNRGSPYQRPDYYENNRPRNMG